MFVTVTFSLNYFHPTKKVLLTIVEMTKEEDVRRLAQEAVSHFGTVHIIVSISQDV